MVLRRRQHGEVLAVAEGQHRQLPALQALLQQDLRAGRPEPSAHQHGLDRGGGLLLGLGNDHPLARGQAGGLDHRYVGSGAEVPLRLAGVAEDMSRRGWDLIVEQELLAVGLGRLEGRVHDASGPNAATPAAASASTRPAANGPSGPTATSSTDSRRQSSTSPAMSPAATGAFSARSQAPIPGLPGAAISRSTCSERSAPKPERARGRRRPPPARSSFAQHRCEAILGAPAGAARTPRPRTGTRP